MPIEKRPANPLTKDFVPPNSKKYRVKDRDSWITVAMKYRMDVNDLIYYNFQTKNVAEINWYLRRNVGCNQTCSDGWNWRFSSSANPGIIYIPVRIIKMPPLTIMGNAPSKWDTIWAGLGKYHSGDFFIFGAHDLTARIYNLGNELSGIKNATINRSGYKIGPGLGGSVGAVFVIAHGYKEACQIKGVSGGFDFDVAIMAKLGDFLKGVKGLGKVVDTIEKYKKLRYLTENAVKNIGITKPGVYTIPIPLAGTGLHLWAGFKFGDITLVSTGEGIP